jgi:basic amino acid/polyamine antiporter, APA family
MESSGQMQQQALESPPSGIDATAAAGGLFIRRSSGLVREVGVAGAFGINVGFLNIGGAIGYIALILTLFPGANPLIALVVGGIFTAIVGIIYAQLSISMPRDGGDFIYQARVFRPIVGAWIGIAFLVGLFYLLGSAESFFVAAFVSPALETLGQVLHVHFLETLAADVLTKSGSLIAGVILTLIPLAAVWLGSRLASRIAYWLVVAGLLGLVVSMIDLLTHSGAGFVNAFNAGASAPHAYSRILADARAAGFRPGYSTKGTLNAVPYGFFCFSLFWMSSYVAGEVKQPGRTQKMAAWLAIGFGVVFCALSWVAMKTGGRTEFIQASAYLSDHNPSALAKLSGTALSPVPYSLLLGNGITKVLIALGYIAWVLPGGIGGMLACSRILFALSFDRLLPKSVAKVSGKRASPIVAVVITAVITIAFYALVVYDQGLSAAFRNIITLLSVVSFAAMVACMALPYRRPDLYQSSPAIFKGKFLGIERVVWMAGVGAAFCAVVAVMTLTQSQYGSQFSFASASTLIGCFVVGPIVYGVSRVVQRNRGIDVSLSMRELPPE